MPAGDATYVTPLGYPETGYPGGPVAIAIGQDGLSILHGVGVPDPLLGRVGEFYIRVNPAGIPEAIYGPKSDPGWGQPVPFGGLGPTGPAGPPGPPGATGGRRFHGIGPPPVLIVGSSAGDEYLDITTGDLYALE